MRNLTSEEIAKFSSRKGVKAIAVGNFLCSMGDNSSYAYGNLEMDARLYRWNAATVKAISAGIALASKGEIFRI